MVWDLGYWFKQGKNLVYGVQLLVQWFILVIIFYMLQAHRSWPALTLYHALCLEFNICTNSFFLLSVFLGCNIRPRGDYVQREIEKEQIRREIIAAETARRKELIAEVAQEMAIEREMAIKSIAEKEDKIATWITQRKLSTHQSHNNNNFSKLKRTYSDPAMYTSPNSLVTSPMKKMPPLQQMLEATEAKETSVLESNKDKLIILVKKLSYIYIW